MIVTEWMSYLLVAAGMVFFLAGTLGLLRFPDVLARLHALTKTDNLGLGLIILAAAVTGPGWSPCIKLVMIWMLTMLSSATACYMIAQSVRVHEPDASPCEPQP